MASPLSPPVHHLALRDGRRLAYSFFGAPRQWRRLGRGKEEDSGPAGESAISSAAPAAAASEQHQQAAEEEGQEAPRCVLYLHGFCSSRLEAGLLHPHAQHHGLAVVALDRPGAGASTHNPAQSVESMAEDARELLDALGLQSVAVMGASGGSPFACAIAALLPERVEALVLVCPLMPTCGLEDQLLPGHSPTTLRLFHGVRDQPWRLWATLHVLRFIQRVPHGSLLLRLSGFAPEDLRACQELPACAAQLKAAAAEGLRQGVAGALGDLQLFYVHPPTTDLAAIRCPAHVWIGGQDATTPPAMARHYAATIPGAALHELPGEAHLSLPFRHNRAILGSIAGAAQPDTARL